MCFTSDCSTTQPSIRPSEKGLICNRIPSCLAAPLVPETPKEAAYCTSTLPACLEIRLTLVQAIVSCLESALRYIHHHEKSTCLCLSRGALQIPPSAPGTSGPVSFVVIFSSSSPNFAAIRGPTAASCKSSPSFDVIFALDLLWAGNSASRFRSASSKFPSSVPASSITKLSKRYCMDPFTVGFLTAFRLVKATQLAKGE